MQYIVKCDESRAEMVIIACIAGMQFASVNVELCTELQSMQRSALSFWASMSGLVLYLCAHFLSLEYNERGFVYPYGKPRMTATLRIVYVVAFNKRNRSVGVYLPESAEPSSGQPRGAKAKISQPS